MILVILPFTGLFGIDHLILRSPITALLKFLSIVPLFGFWYFYDIAQVTGERELVEKYGIGVPFYGPTGIGAGMFHNQGATEAPNNSPRPWRYLIYVFTTFFSIFFPINKLVLGDYMGAIVHLLMYVLFPLTFFAIIWTFYDMYRVIFDTEGIFDNGPARFFPASLLLNPYFDRTVLGPLTPDQSSSIIGRVIGLAADATIGVGEVVVGQTKNVVNTVGRDTTQVIDTTAAVSSQVVESAGTAAEALSSSLEQGAQASGKVVELIGKLPDIGEKIATDLPNKIAQQATSPVSKAISTANTTLQKPGTQLISHIAKQAGGSLDSPSISTTALLFSVGLLAFSGYVFYTLRNTMKTNRDKSDEPPRDSGATRVSAKTDEPAW
jgi:hypothetical protein